MSRCRSAVSTWRGTFRARNVLADVLSRMHETGSGSALPPQFACSLRLSAQTRRSVVGRLGRAEGVGRRRGGVVPGRGAARGLEYNRPKWWRRGGGWRRGARPLAVAGPRRRRPEVARRCRHRAPWAVVGAPQEGPPGCQRCANVVEQASEGSAAGETRAKATSACGPHGAAAALAQRASRGGTEDGWDWDSVAVPVNATGVAQLGPAGGGGGPELGARIRGNGVGGRGGSGADEGGSGRVRQSEIRQYFKGGSIERIFCARRHCRWRRKGSTCSVFAMREAGYRLGVAFLEDKRGRAWRPPHGCRACCASAQKKQ